jgi:2'-5' RNA ligase
MEEFTSYFIGIPLPVKFQKEFEVFLQKVSMLSPSLQMVYPKTPHITIYYLTKFPKIIISEVNDLLSTRVDTLKNSQITIGGLGIFGGENPKTIFLDTLCPKELKLFRKRISKIFVNNSAKDNFMPFYPHMTIATVKTENYTKEFISAKQDLENLLEGISWKFPITEIALYGADSTQSPEYQKKLASIFIN